MAAPTKSTSAVVRISASLDARLARLSEKTGRSKSYYTKKALERFLEDTEDYLMAVAALEEPGRSFSLEEIIRNSDWKIEFRPKARRELGQLPQEAQQRIVDFLTTRVAPDPRRLGDALQGRLGGLWRYRVGDYRLICKLEDERITVVVVDIGHRREVYRG